MTVRTITDCWNEFFFRPKSTLPIAVYRILLGLLLFANQILILPEVDVWFSLEGVLSWDVSRNIPGGRGFTLFEYLPLTDGSIWLVYSLSCVLALTLALGLFTRFSAIAVFLCLVSIQHRDALVLNSGDSFLRIATFFIIFTHAGSALSLDRWMRIRRGKEKPGPAPLREPWAMRLIQIQLSCLYLYSVAWKIMGPMWMDGSALYYTSRLQEFWRFPLPYIFEHMWTIKLWTWSTLLFEFALAALIWIKEFRYWVMLAGVMLHLGIDWTMNIPLFGLIMMSVYVLWIDPAHLERALGYVKSKATSILRRDRKLKPAAKPLSPQAAK